MKPEKIHTCLEKYLHLKKSEQESPKLAGKELTQGEVFTIDDYQSLGFKGYNNKNRPKEDTKNWANDSQRLARFSKYLHLAEIPLKFLSYFTNHSENNEGLLPRALFVLERATDTLGGMSRNNIYAHEDNKKNQDDNLGAEKFAQDTFGDTTTYRIAVTNNYYQTMGRFLIPVIGALSPHLANDLDWLLGGTLDAIRWKRTASNSGFYPGFLHDIFHTITGGGEIKPILNFAKERFKEHCQGAKNAWQVYKNTSGRESLIHFYKNIDQVTSAFLALSQWPNIIGDILRPVARRLAWEGIPRHLVRFLSVIDRPFIWINYLFRFYLPERIGENNNNQGIVNNSTLLPIAIGGDILDFTTTLFQDKIKDLSPWVEHPLNLIGIVKSSFFKIFFSGRRERIASQTLNELNDRKINSN